MTADDRSGPYAGNTVLAAFLRGIAVAVVFAGLLAMLPRPASAADDFGDLVESDS